MIDWFAAGGGNYTRLAHSELHFCAANVVPLRCVETADCTAVSAALHVVVGLTWKPVAVGNLPVFGPLPVSSASFCRLIQADPHGIVRLDHVANCPHLVFIRFGFDYGEFSELFLASILRIFPCLYRRCQVIHGLTGGDGDDGYDGGDRYDDGGDRFDDGTSHGKALLVGRHEVHVDDRLRGCLKKPLDVARFAIALATQDAIEMHRVEAPMVVLVKGREAIPAGFARFA